MNLADFDYSLPPDLIAQEPAPERDHSRLMVLDRKKDTLLHEPFCRLADYLTRGDALVVNDTKVWPARLLGKKESGGKIEVLLIRKREGKTAGEAASLLPGEEYGEWDCLIQEFRETPPKCSSFVR